jgi:WD40 repeat protein
MGAAAGRLLKKKPKPPDEWETIYEGYHTGAITAVCFGDGGKTLVTASADGTACVWSALSGSHRLTLPHAANEGHGDALTSCACDADASRVVTGSLDHDARIWDAATGATLFALKTHKGHVYGVCFSVDGDRVATASGDWTAVLWNALTGAPETTIRGHIDTVNCVAFNRDGTRVATGSGDKTVRVWDASKHFSTDLGDFAPASGAQVASLEGHEHQVTTSVETNLETRRASEVCSARSPLCFEDLRRSRTDPSRRIRSNWTTLNVS